MLTDYFSQQPKLANSAPKFEDFVASYFLLFNEFEYTQSTNRKRGRPFTYDHAQLIVFFTIMVCRRIVDFKAQHRWLINHQNEAQLLGLLSIPDRSTLSKRWKSEYKVVIEFINFIGERASLISEKFSNDDLFEDSSVLRSMGNLWHASDRRRDPVNPPKRARNIDRDANWTKSRYHGFVFGYKTHLTVNFNSFPKCLLVESANYSDSKAIEEKEKWLLQLKPKNIVTDNGYFQATRIKRWQSNGIQFLTPACNWVNTKPAIEYHELIKQPKNARLLCYRKVVIEPVFDLLPKIFGARNNHKQLSMKSLGNVQTLISLSVLALQVAMLENHKRGFPLRTINFLLDSFR